jgi:adenylate cyclase
MQRKLTAILSADVVGYSGMMETDEAGTLGRLKENRVRVFDPAVSSHGGRQFKLMGDGALVEFASVVAAVNCALEIQAATEKAAEREAKPIRYRIGINLGDVIIEDDDIYGEGVNVAARVQTVAPAGRVAVSKTVRDHVEGKVNGLFEDMGQHSVKNNERAVHVFSVSPMPNPNSAASEKMSAPRKLAVCVLPFANMSGDAEQEYFSDGISEDIITDLSKVSSLSVISRNSAFMYKGQNVDLPKVARELKVSHVLEGSVRKAGGRVRITAQLIDGASNDHIWAERYDRDLNDIFALQDEISEAIVAALKLKLLPEEKKAIEQRGTESVEAYNLYLMARQNYATGFEGDRRRNETTIRMSERATQIDPNYARAWALLALGRMNLRNATAQGDGGMQAAEKALALDPNQAEAYAVKARILEMEGRGAEGLEEIAVALQLDPDSYEVNRSAGIMLYRNHQLERAIRHFEKAQSLMDTDFTSAGMLVSCYTAVGNHEAALNAAQITLARAERVLAHDPNNGMAMGHGSDALAVLGRVDRALEWMNRALLIEPENFTMRYNFACALGNHLKRADAAIEMLEPVFANISLSLLNHAKADPDMDPLRDHPRFKEMVAAAEARLAGDRQETPSQ